MDDAYSSGGSDMMDVEYEEDMEITQEDAWLVIGTYFKEKGLVSQQVDSFDEFMQNMVQELINDTGKIVVIPENQYIPGEEIEQVNHTFNFNRSYSFNHIL
jgi:DNA-directed RNA polymerase II subunit RPB2